MVVIPKKFGVAVRFEAAGHSYYVKRLRGREYCLANQTTGRVRFGNLAEIRSDLEYLKANGCLPPRSGKSFA